MNQQHYLLNPHIDATLYKKNSQGRTTLLSHWTTALSSTNVPFLDTRSYLSVTMTLIYNRYMVSSNIRPQGKWYSMTCTLHIVKSVLS